MGRAVDNSGMPVCRPCKARLCEGCLFFDQSVLVLKSVILSLLRQAIIALFAGFSTRLRDAVDNLSQVTVERSVDKLRTLASRPQWAGGGRSRLFFVQLGCGGISRAGLMRRRLSGGA